MQQGYKSSGQTYQPRYPGLPPQIPSCRHPAPLFPAITLISTFAMCRLAVKIYAACCHRGPPDDYVVLSACKAHTLSEYNPKDIKDITPYGGFCPSCLERKDSGEIVTKYRPRRICGKWVFWDPGTEAPIEWLQEAYPGLQVNSEPPARAESRGLGAPPSPIKMRRHSVTLEPRNAPSMFGKRFDFRNLHRPDFSAATVREKKYRCRALDARSLGAPLPAPRKYRPGRRLVRVDSRGSPAKE